MIPMKTVTPDFEANDYDWEDLSQSLSGSDSEDLDNDSSFSDLDDNDALKIRVANQKREIADLRAKLFVATDQLIHFRKFFSLPDLGMAPAPSSTVTAASQYPHDGGRIASPPLTERIPVRDSPKLFRTTTRTSGERLWHFLCDDVTPAFCNLGRVYRMAAYPRLLLYLYFISIHLALFWSLF